MKDFLDRAAKAYYDGNPIISDEEFDALSAAYQYEDVGTSDGEVPHLFQMYSLQKVFEGEASPTIFSEHDLVVTPKLEGRQWRLSMKMDFLFAALLEEMVRKVE
jgi:DNA ligase (NAD+)